MLSNLFINTDIILDVVLNRKLHYEQSEAIFKCFENSQAKLYTSASVIINAHYIAQKELPKEKCRNAMAYLVEYFEILEPGKQQELKAYNSTFTDVEDAIQYYTAKDSGIIDFLITRNTKDYKHALKSLPALTPGQFLKKHIK
ncbi:MAG: PIN domain-containing protein [Ferruginibacter sp.]